MYEIMCGDDANRRNDENSQINIMRIGKQSATDSASESPTERRANTDAGDRAKEGEAGLSENTLLLAAHCTVTRVCVVRIHYNRIYFYDSTIKFCLNCKQWANARRERRGERASLRPKVEASKNINLCIKKRLFIMTFADSFQLSGT